jgi:hypothetical protein
MPFSTAPAAPSNSSVRYGRPPNFYAAPPERCGKRTALPRDGAFPADQPVDESVTHDVDHTAVGPNQPRPDCHAAMTAETVFSRLSEKEWRTLWNPHRLYRGYFRRVRAP